MFRRTQHDIPIIILSDEDEDDGDALTTLNDSSVLIVENERNEAGNVSLLYTHLIITNPKFTIPFVTIHMHYKTVFGHITLLWRYHVFFDTNCSKCHGFQNYHGNKYFCLIYHGSTSDIPLYTIYTLVIIQ